MTEDYQSDHEWDEETRTMTAPRKRDPYQDPGHKHALHLRPTVLTDNPTADYRWRAWVEVRGRTYAAENEHPNAALGQLVRVLAEALDAEVESDYSTTLRGRA